MRAPDWMIYAAFFMSSTTFGWMIGETIHRIAGKDEDTECRKRLEDIIRTLHEMNYGE